MIFVSCLYFWTIYRILYHHLTNTSPRDFRPSELILVPRDYIYNGLLLQIRTCIDNCLIGTHTTNMYVTLFSDFPGVAQKHADTT